jgi:hypothetical protein
MSDDRKQPSAGLCVAFIALLPVLYCLSLGPVAGLVNNREVSGGWYETAIEVYFAPANFVYENSPETVQQVMKAYVGFFTGEA